jgi:fructose-1,6-bisphosphatase I
MAQQVDHSNPITLTRYILAEKEIHANQDLSLIFSSIELACKVIASSVRRAGTSVRVCF